MHPLREKLLSCRLGLAVALAACLCVLSAVPQDISKYRTLTNAQVAEILDTVEADIKEHYWDPGMHGFDLNKKFTEARQKISAAKSQNEALLYVAGAAAALNDSHTHFIPPEAPYTVEQGWRAQIIGDSHCYVTQVLAGSDAEAKGLKRGDEIISINSIKVTPENFASIEHGYRVFLQSGFRLIVRSRDGKEREVVAMVKVVPGQQYIRRADLMAWARAHAYDVPEDRSQYHESGHTVFWKLHDFFVQPENIEKSLKKIRPFEAVVLDLRGNPGGSEAVMSRLVGAFFVQDVRIGESKGRKKSEPLIAKTHGQKAFGGKLVVLIDRKSSSGAEIFARVIQMEKRGVVIGDRSAGAVMEAHFFPHTISLGPTSVAHYGAMVTEANLIMADSRSLEGVGVIPDERVLPSPVDLEVGNDPALTRAAELTGAKMSPEEAGKVFPFQWPKKMPDID